MAVKWRSRAQRLEEEARRTGRVILSSSALERGAEGCIRFLLGAILAGGEIFGGWSPFAVGFTAASGAGAGGLCALLGAVLGSLLFRGFRQGLRCAAACLLVYSVAFAFWDGRLSRRPWFLPLTAAGMDALTGFVYLSGTAWRVSQAVYFATEVLLAGVSAWLYRQALSAWRTREDAPRTALQKGGAAYLLGTLLIALAGVTFLRDLSAGRVLGALLVMALAYAGGPGLGAASGVAAGVCLDLAAGGSPFYTMAYGFSGLLTGAGWKQGRLFAVLSYIVSNAAAVLWTWDGNPKISSLYEVFIASVAFLLLPAAWLHKLEKSCTRAQNDGAVKRGVEIVSRRLETCSRAFRGLYQTLISALPPRLGANDGDPAMVFDRTAERVCRRCALRDECWERSYATTFTALNDALAAMLERGRGEPTDFPGWFAAKCLHFPAFLKVANEELTALFYRREYRARVEENRGAVCREYGTLADILSSASAELSAELTPDPVRERRLRGHLTALELEGEAAVYYDAAGRLRAEVTGEDPQALEPLRAPEEEKALSQLLGIPLRREPEDEGPGRVVFRQAEPYLAVAGVAARRREGQTESGDTGAWFKRSDGSLFVLLCDGMGSGEAARRESALAVRLLENFLRSGLTAPAALRTVNAALALKNQETGAFTTVDLLRLDLFTGEGEVCKYGAAPTYLRRGTMVGKVSGTSLPAGLADGDRAEPDVTPFRLSPGDCAVLLSDGLTAPEDDQWVKDALLTFDGQSPKDLARQLMEESEKRVGAGDDRTAIVVKMERRED